MYVTSSVGQKHPIITLKVAHIKIWAYSGSSSELLSVTMAVIMFSIRGILKPNICEHLSCKQMQSKLD